MVTIDILFYFMGAYIMRPGRPKNLTGTQGVPADHCRESQANGILKLATPTRDH
jgi:hypothetical protein